MCVLSRTDKNANYVHSKVHTCKPGMFACVVGGRMPRRVAAFSAFRFLTQSQLIEEIWPLYSLFAMSWRLRDTSCRTRRQIQLSLPTSFLFLQPTRIYPIRARSWCIGTVASSWTRMLGRVSLVNILFGQSTLAFSQLLSRPPSIASKRQIQRKCSPGSFHILDLVELLALVMMSLWLWVGTIFELRWRIDTESALDDDNTGTQNLCGWSGSLRILSMGLLRMLLVEDIASDGLDTALREMHVGHSAFREHEAWNIPIGAFEVDWPNWWIITGRYYELMNERKWEMERRWVWTWRLKFIAGGTTHVMDDVSASVFSRTTLAPLLTRETRLLKLNHSVDSWYIPCLSIRDCIDTTW